MPEFDPEEVEELFSEDKPLTGYSEPRYVISFINQQPGLVVRGNSVKEIEQATNAILPYFRRFREATEKAKVAAQTAQNKPLGDVIDQYPEQTNCPEHGVPIYRKEGKYGLYYSHKMGEAWCNKKLNQIIK